MRRRSLRWTLAGPTVALLAAGAFVLWPRPDRITRENFGRIKEGMSRAEVEATPGMIRVSEPNSVSQPPGCVVRARALSRTAERREKRNDRVHCCG
jgi:hypothetical protein